MAAVLANQTRTGMTIGKNDIAALFNDIVNDQPSLALAA